MRSRSEHLGGCCENELTTSCMKMNKKIDHIISALGGSAAVARSIEQYPALVRQWKTRGSIPSAWWWRIVKAAKKQDIDVSLESLMKANL